ncbi:phosphatase PAP2 family protein [Catenovulum sp. 2E275]|uniref:phosphatase PAP2 family protein n=1 Tax=Catenovulum sp. 2E275 TaxID=2980497 RepID=UPI0021D35AA0|nr:phosphatase PAP2 family protein [Catenovulum sp. 2E275]MCU4675176.1 phosphatase PAP2 family protein [Catenovulum sp. 2E275]
MPSSIFKKKHLTQAILVGLVVNLTACEISLEDDDTNTDQQQVNKPLIPTGLGAEHQVDAPDSVYPRPTVLNAENNANSDYRYNINENPIAHILNGINDIWYGTAEGYQQNASGNGPDQYVENPIIDADAWQHNIQYVVDVTNNRSDEQTISAFLDDRRSKNYSVIDGYGPLTEDYVANSGAYVELNEPTLAQVLEDEHYLPDHNDNIIYAGSADTELGAIYQLVFDFRQASPASTSASKYIYSTPRPWRMNDSGAVEFTGTEKAYSCTTPSGDTGEYIVDTYTTNVKVVPGLICARRMHSDSYVQKGLYTDETENRRKDGGYPSGHTNAGYLAAFAYAYALPQRYSEMLTRASQLGESRILAGMHSPVDVIGGRIHATAVAAFGLSQSHIYADAQAAYQKAQSYFGEKAQAVGMSLYEYAHQNVEEPAGLINGDKVRTSVYNNNDWADHDANKALYRSRLTYGFTQDPQKAGQDPIVPAGAELLLESRQPYLTAAQRRSVLYTTEIDSGYPILDNTNGWGRIDLVTAADGYGAFLGDVTVIMDASEGGFSEHDWWRNDISGAGMLTKAGSGMLTLTGDNSYSGGTVLKYGTLEAESPTAFGNGDVYQQGGTLMVDSQGSLSVNQLTIDAGQLHLIMDADQSQIIAQNTVYLENADLVIDFTNFPIESGTQITLISGAQIAGEFNQVTAQGYSVSLQYTDTQVIATVSTN